jgi:hypothetical protein
MTLNIDQITFNPYKRVMRKTLKSVLAVTAASVMTTAGTLVLTEQSAWAAPACTRTYTTILRPSLLTLYIPSTGTTAASTSCNLAEGARNDAVHTLQLTLNHCYGRGIAEDRQFGPATRAALLAVQRRFPSIPHDGQYGPLTRDSIIHYTSNGGCFGFDGPGGL